jgi:hypothetical protein
MYLAIVLCGPAEGLGDVSRALERGWETYLAAVVTVGAIGGSSGFLGWHREDGGWLLSGLLV